MTKTQVLEFFGTSVAAGKALGITHAAVCLWPEELTQAKADQVRGAMVRLGYHVPAYMRTDEPMPKNNRRISPTKRLAILNQG